MKVALMSNPYNRVDLFEEAGLEVLEGPTRTTEEMIDLLRDADGALVNIIPATSREVLEACPKLKVVSRMGVGVDSIDHDAATDLGVLVCNTPGVNTTEVADHAVALLLSLTRCLHDAIHATREGKWSTDRPTIRGYQTGVRRIAGHTVGIIGFGNIGRAFATRIRGFGPSEIIAFDPYVPQGTGDLYGVRMVSFEELLSGSDYITIHCSATDETRHMIDSNALGLMKDTAMIVNTARGPIIDGAALADAARWTPNVDPAHRGSDRSCGRRPRRHGNRADRPGRSPAAPAERRRDPAHRRLLADVPRGLSGAAGGERDPRPAGAGAPRSYQPRGDQDHRGDAVDRSGPLGGRAGLLDGAGRVGEGLVPSRLAACMVGARPTTRVAPARRPGPRRT